MRTVRGQKRTKRQKRRDADHMRYRVACAKRKRADLAWLRKHAPGFYALFTPKELAV